MGGHPHPPLPRTRRTSPVGAARPPRPWAQPGQHGTQQTLLEVLSISAGHGGGVVGARQAVEGLGFQRDVLPAGSWLRSAIVEVNFTVGLYSPIHSPKVLAITCGPRRRVRHSGCWQHPQPVAWPFPSRHRHDLRYQIPMEPLIGRPPNAGGRAAGILRSRPAP